MDGVPLRAVGGRQYCRCLEVAGMGIANRQGNPICFFASFETLGWIRDKAHERRDVDGTLNAVGS
jgi:hypothetical protein